jgi:hypothetical protein
MGEPAAGVVGEELGGDAREDLGFAGKAAEGAGMQDSRSVSGEWAPVRVRGFRMQAGGEGPGSSGRNGDSRRQRRGRGGF